MSNVSPSSKSSLFNIDVTLLIASIFAISLHLILIFGISFSEGKAPDTVARDVAKAIVKNMKKNEDAKFISDGAQKGSGKSEKVQRLETSEISPLVDSEINDTQDIVNRQKQIRQREYQQSYLNTTISWRDSDKENDNKDDSNSQDFEELQDRIRKDIATLEAQLSQQAKVLSSKSKIETIDSNSTTYGAISEFLESFRIHVERVANQNYASKIFTRGLTGEVRLMVIIRNDGTVKAIRLLESSGSHVLDEAAKDSVRESAPYGKFTKDMKELLELRIIRTWRYSDGITTVQDSL